MTEEIPYLLIGTYGWDDNEWAENYYEPDQPKEWRFLTYSSHYRSVLVPNGFINETDAVSIAQWAEECDDDFRFVLELSEATLGQFDSKQALSLVVEQFLEKIRPVDSYITGYLLRPKAPSLAVKWLQILLPIVAAKKPISVAMPGIETSDNVMVLLDQYNAGLCWFPDAESNLPEVSADLVVAITDTTNPKTMRGIIEDLAKVLNNYRQAALFFQGKNAAAAAWQARVIADLMVV